MDIKSFKNEKKNRMINALYYYINNKGNISQYEVAKIFNVAERNIQRRWKKFVIGN